MSSPGAQDEPGAGPAADLTAEAFLTAVAPVLVALGGQVIALEDRTGGDVVLEWGGEPLGAVRPPDLNGALDRLVAAVEGELGGPLKDLSREDKQLAVTMLEERGAFTLRKSVEDLAALLDVSRFTVYNYLNARLR